MKKLSAFNDSREYFFTLNSQDKDRVSITMYGGEYTLIRTAKGWENASGNKNALAAGLIAGVITALGIQ